MEKLQTSQDLRKIEMGALEKNLAALNAKGYLTPGEATLRDTLKKKLADGASFDAFKEARRQPKIRV